MSHVCIKTDLHPAQERCEGCDEEGPDDDCSHVSKKYRRRRRQFDVGVEVDEAPGGAGEDVDGGEAEEPEAVVHLEEGIDNVLQPGEGQGLKINPCLKSDNGLYLYMAISVF